MHFSPVIRVLSIGAHPLIHAGLRQFGSSFPDLQFVGEAYDGREALSVYERLVPDVVLIDALGDHGDSIATIVLLRERDPQVRAVVVAVVADSWSVEGAFRAGASGYLLHSMSSFDLAQAIRAVAGGRVAIAPEVAQQMYRALKHPPSPIPSLNERERAVLSYVVRGHTNAQIAQLMSMSCSTVKYYIAGMFDKLGVTCRSELVALAYEYRLVIPGELIREDDQPAARPVAQLSYAMRAS